jgi:hypothetical protein
MQTRIDDITNMSVRICAQLHTIYTDNIDAINSSSDRKTLYNNFIADSTDLADLYTRQAALITSAVHDANGIEDELINLLRTNLVWINLQHTQHVVDFTSHIFNHITAKLTYMRV